jgi:hypothetical protein
VVKEKLIAYRPGHTCNGAGYAFVVVRHDGVCVCEIFRVCLREVLSIWIGMVSMVQYTGSRIRYVVTADHTPHLTSSSLSRVSAERRQISTCQIQGKTANYLTLLLVPAMPPAAEVHSRSECRAAQRILQLNEHLLSIIN